MTDTTNGMCQTLISDKPFKIQIVRSHPPLIYYYPGFHSHSQRGKWGLDLQNLFTVLVMYGTKAATFEAKSTSFCCASRPLRRKVLLHVFLAVLLDSGLMLWLSYCSGEEYLEIKTSKITFSKIFRLSEWVDPRRNPQLSSIMRYFPFQEAFCRGHTDIFG